MKPSHLRMSQDEGMRAHISTLNSTFTLENVLTPAINKANLS